MQGPSEPGGGRPAARATSEGTAAAGPGPPAWLPNAITLVRVGLIPVFVWVAEACASAADAGDAARGLRWAATGVLLAIGVSDVLDGHLARRHGLGTPLGAMLDVFADKLAQVALIGFFALRSSAAFANLPVWFLAVVVGRDVVLLAGSLLVRWRRGRVRMEHQGHGKLTSALVFGLLLWITLGLDARVVLPAAIACAALAVPSTLAYVREGVAQWSGARAGPADSSR